MAKGKVKNTVKTKKSANMGMKLSVFLGLIIAIPITVVGALVATQFSTHAAGCHPITTYDNTNYNGPNNLEVRLTTNGCGEWVGYYKLYVGNGQQGGTFFTRLCDTSNHCQTHQYQVGNGVTVKYETRGPQTCGYAAGFFLQNNKYVLINGSGSRCT